MPEAICCRRCSSSAVTKNGKIRGEQRYHCKICHYNFVDKPRHGRPTTQKALAIVLYNLGMSMNSIARLLDLSPPAVLKWIHSFAGSQATKPEPPDDGVIVVELDEMWHYLKKKSNKLWIWKAYCRDTGQLVDWECRDRDQATLERLLERLTRWHVKLYCTDHFAPYDMALPVGRHFQGKEETWRSEQNNGRQRHWYRRFQRRTIVVSKSLEMVDRSVALFARFHVNGRLDEVPHLFGLPGLTSIFG